MRDRVFGLLRFVFRLFAFGVVSAAIGFIILSYFAYRLFMGMNPNCPTGIQAQNTPANFVAEGIDLSAYHMPQYETVRMPSRTPSITLSAYWIPASVSNVAAAPAVVLVHGVNACKSVANSLLPAGMLHKAGFNTLVIDLRNMGGSMADNGLTGAGTKEYLDVLGAWDWLVNTQKIPPARIGLFGFSLGGTSVLIAGGREGRVAAVFADSPFAGAEWMVRYYEDAFGLPAPLTSLALTVGRIATGDNLMDDTLSAHAAMSALHTRPVFLTHGTADVTVPYMNSVILGSYIRSEQRGNSVWLIPASHHVAGMFDRTAEYEKKLVGFFRASLQ